MTASFRPCAIIPTRNHWLAIDRVVAALRALDLPVFVIDDGSDEPARTALAGLKTQDLGGGFHRFEVNQGKGGAVLQGVQMALAAGYSHAVQVDADGQHDLSALPKLLERARRHPEALVTGVPSYDASVPVGRAIGRWITHVWVWIETLSFRIRDSMCGFRVYPLAPLAALLADGIRLGRRMDFDTEIMVRLFWRGTPVSSLPVAVTYPPENTSNFDMLRDNWLISLMHVRLVLTMLANLPSILAHRPPRLDDQHWSWLAERGTSWGLRFCLASYRLLGRSGCRIVLMPVVLYFYLTGGEQRRASHQFLIRAFRAKNWQRRPGFFDGYRHFLSFASRSLDTFVGWAGHVPAGTIRHENDADLKEASANKRGALIVVSHHGNVDFSRALLDDASRERLVILVHTRHAENYNKVLREFRPTAAVNTFQVTELGPETAIALKDYVEGGKWVVIAGDRTPIKSQGYVANVPFLGEKAPFSLGPYLLAALLECPVYLLFCQRDGQHHRLTFEKFAERIELPRHDRLTQLRDYARQFAVKLEEQTLRDPFQWYNFFDFWAPQREAD